MDSRMQLSKLERIWTSRLVLEVKRTATKTNRSGLSSGSNNVAVLGTTTLVRRPAGVTS